MEEEEEGRQRKNSFQISLSLSLSLWTSLERWAATVVSIDFPPVDGRLARTVHQEG